MSSRILGWANVVMDTAEVAALGAAIWLLLRVDRKIAAMLRVIRRIDRKTAEPTKSPHRRQAELNEAPPELTGNRQPELDRMVADWTRLWHGSCDALGNGEPPTDFPAFTVS
jgi:hypothetical protein